MAKKNGARAKKASNGKRNPAGTGVLSYMQGKFANLITRWTNYSAQMKKLSFPADNGLYEKCEKALAGLNTANEALGKIDSEWRPPRGAINAKPLEPGQKIRIKEKYLEKHSFMDDKLKKTSVLVIEKVVGGRLVATFNDSKFGMPRAHIELVAEN